MTAQHRPRLLFLSPIIPANRGNGLAMRTGFFLDAYASSFEIHLALFPILAAPEPVADFVRRRVARVEVFPRPAVDAHFSLISATRDATHRLSAFRRYGQPSLASYAGAAPRAALEQWAGQFNYDVVHVERLYLAPLAQRWTSRSLRGQPLLAIDCDEDDAGTYRQLASLERRYDRPQAAAWADLEADAFASMAKRVLPQFDIAFAESNGDAASLSTCGARVSVVPNVVTPGRMRDPYCRAHRHQSVLFAGTMAYAPNDDAARWLLTRIWPRLLRSVSTPVRLILAGSNPSRSLIRLCRRRDVLVTGTVRDMAPYYRNADLAVLPLRAGGGTRIKLLEAAAHGVPIVSTAVGAGGTAFRNGHELLLADTADRFAHACAALLQDRQRARRLAAQARVKVVRDHDSTCWGRRVLDLVALSCPSSKELDPCRK